MQAQPSAKAECDPQTPLSRCSCAGLCSVLPVLTPSDGNDKKGRPKEALCT